MLKQAGAVSYLCLIILFLGLIRLLIIDSRRVSDPFHRKMQSICQQLDFGRHSGRVVSTVGSKQEGSYCQCCHIYQDNIGNENVHGFIINYKWKDIWKEHIEFAKSKVVCVG